jgi:cation diffusion facilitator CzcD-associated flavoprotein CzcO
MAATVMERHGAVMGEEKYSRAEHYDVVVIGAGQAGLATGYYLAKHNLNFTILDAGRLPRTSRCTSNASTCRSGSACG